ncbi:MAG TPA: hypothetical protein ENN51_01955 [candidate division WOR-3 bacterium]|uniref:Uncharacterized protein n=1 Tax=candidate division WOR-3 bacterium TaxID=2052148 RepID=A0A7V0T556_UNCW3|nr:hypothetical protein [candidate division WOR-3 bacterium]
MSNINPAQRIAKWNAKYDTGRIKATLDELRDRMYMNVQSVFPMLTSMEEQVRQTLDADGVSVIQYPFYLSFGREVWARIRRGMSGNSLALEVATLVAKWTARGLSPSTLENVRFQVFNVSAPVGP